MTDHIHDSEITAALKRAEAAEREAAKMRELYRIDGVLLALLLSASVVMLLLFSYEHGAADRAQDARDACEVQAQLYLDGWRQCKREAGASTLQEDYGDGSLLDPTKRIDR